MGEELVMLRGDAETRRVETVDDDGEILKVTRACETR